MIISLPIPGYLAKLLHGAQHNLMKRTDARVQAVTEMMSVVRMIKLFGWEGKIAERLEKKRAEELRYLRTSEMLKLGTAGVTLCVPSVPVLSSILTGIYSFVPVFQMVSTLAVFTLVMGSKLTRMCILLAVAFDVHLYEMH